MLSIKNKELLLDEYKSELSKTEATLEAMKKIKIKEQECKCPLCNSLVKPGDVTHNKVEDIEYVGEQLSKKIVGLEKLLSNEREKIYQIDANIEKDNYKKRIFLNALNEFKQNLEMPYLAEIESINSLIRDLQEQKNKLNSLYDMHNEMEANCRSLNECFLY